MRRDTEKKIRAVIITSITNRPFQQGKYPRNIKHVGQHTCSVCKNFEPNIKTCGRCKQKRYCSEKCQEKDWPMHEKFCNILAGQ